MDTIGRYELQEELGRGGMGVVYRAYDSTLEREVALKLLPAYLRGDATFLHRFRREARVVARLEHACIVPIYDVGEQEGQPYLVMRLLRGGALRERLTAASLDQEQLFRALRRVAQALDAAHAQRIVHRDVKPANILFDEQGSAFVSDFGIARVTDAATQLTGSGLVGSPAYMSPEQFKGAEVDGRSDQYSLAIVVYEALSGSLPFSGDTAQMMYQHLEAPPPPVHMRNTALSPSLSPLLARALAKSPLDRFPSVTEMVQALQTAAGSQPALLPPVGPERKSSTTHARQVQSAYTRGLTAWEKQDWAAAAAAFAAVLELEPHHPKARSRYEEAKQHLSTGSTKTPAAAKKRPPAPAPYKSPVVAGAGGAAAPARSSRRWYYLAAALLLALVMGSLAWMFRLRISPTVIVYVDHTATPWLAKQAVIAVTPQPATATDTPSPTATATPSPTSPLEFPSGETAVWQSDDTPIAFALPDGSTLFLDANSQVQIEAIIGEGEAAETRLILQSGRLVVMPGSGVVLVRNPFGAYAQTGAGSLLGVWYSDAPFRFEAACLAGICRLTGDLEGEVALLEGQMSFVGGSGRPANIVAADYAAYTFATVVPTPTTTPTPTVTPPPTATPTRVPPTATPTPSPLPTNTPGTSGGGNPPQPPTPAVTSAPTIPPSPEPPSDR